MRGEPAMPPLKPGQVIVFDHVLGQVRVLDAWEIALWAMGVRRGP